jgi:Protein of unknown function (DUF1207)
MSQFSTCLVHLTLAALGWAAVFSPVGASGLAEDQALTLPFSADRDQQVSPLYETSPLISLATLQGRSEPVLLDEFVGSGLYSDDWGFHLLPDSLIYRSYFAGPKEPRLASQFVKVAGDSWLWDPTLGARVGLFRIGNSDSVRPAGIQVDAEAAALGRLDLLEQMDVRSLDFRAGLPITWGNERRQWKFAYYHLSSHLADEFLLKNPGYPLDFQSRDCLVLGYSYYVIDPLRLYAEVGWSWRAIASQPWEFQLGFDLAPRGPTGIRGKPFVATNAHLRQELNFGGGLTFQAGWAWRSDVTARLLRTGLQYYNGNSPQYAFLPVFEQQVGWGLWYDF